MLGCGGGRQEDAPVMVVRNREVSLLLTLSLSLLESEIRGGGTSSSESGWEGQGSDGYIVDGVPPKA